MTVISWVRNCDNASLLTAMPSFLIEFVKYGSVDQCRLLYNYNLVDDSTVLVVTVTHCPLVTSVLFAWQTTACTVSYFPEFVLVITKQIHLDGERFMLKIRQNTLTLLTFRSVSETFIRGRSWYCQVFVYFCCTVGVCRSSISATRPVPDPCRKLLPNST